MLIEKFTEFRKKRILYLHFALTGFICLLVFESCVIVLDFVSLTPQSLTPAGNVLHDRVVPSAPVDAGKPVDEGLDWRDAKGTTHERDRNSPPLPHATHLPGASKPCPCGLFQVSL